MNKRSITPEEVQAEFDKADKALEGVPYETQTIGKKELHPSVQHILQFFKSDHLPDEIREPAAYCAQLARQMARSLPGNPELTAGLRKLLEAKDCFVRAKLSKEG